MLTHAQSGCSDHSPESVVRVWGGLGDGEGTGKHNTVGDEHLSLIKRLPECLGTRHQLPISTFCLMLSLLPQQT